MFSVRINKVKNVLNVDDDFAMLIDVDNTNMTFRIHYTVSCVRAIQNNALKVRIGVSQTSINLGLLTVPSAFKGFENAKKNVDDELAKELTVKDASSRKTLELVASVVGDVTTKISNTDASVLSMKGSKATDVTSFTKSTVSFVPASQVKQKSQNVVLMNRTSSDTQKKNLINSQVESMKMILKEGVDPSEVASMSHKSTTAYDIIGGFSKISRSFEEVSTSSSVKLRDSLVAPKKMMASTGIQLADDEYVQVIQSVTDDDASMFTDIKIPRVKTTSIGNTFNGKSIAGRLTSGQNQTSSTYSVKFDLIDSNGVVVDTIIKTLNTSIHFQEFNTPIDPPTARIARGSIALQANIELVQNDPRATKIRLYRKYIGNSDINIDPYSFVGEYVVNPGKRRLISETIPYMSTAIYRAIAVSQNGTPGTDFSNVVVQAAHTSRFQYVSVSSTIVSNGVKIDVTSFPTDVVSIRVLRRCASTHEEFMHFGGTIKINSIDTVSIIDTEVTQDFIYEYCVELVYRDGVIKRSGFSTCNYVPLSRGYVKVSISGLSVSGMSQDQSSSVSQLQRTSVTFNINSSMTATSHDDLKRSMISQGIYEHYVNEMNDDRDKLSKLIASNVRRIDVTTGEVVDYGVITTDQFVESDHLEIRSSSPLSFGRKYRYEVTPLLRSAETMFENLTKTMTDETTKRTYTVNPAKSFHPLSLRTGTVTSVIGRSSHIGLDPMSYGKLGQTISIDIDLTSTFSSVTNLRASRFNQLKNIVTWNINADEKRVDHFIVMKDAGGVRTIIGKVNTESASGNYTFFHSLTQRDAGQLIYIVTPVYSSYNRGAEIFSTPVYVDPSDVKIIRDVQRQLTLSSGQSILK